MLTSGVPSRAGRRAVALTVVQPPAKSGRAIPTVHRVVAERHAPEAVAGGPLALAETGDRIRLSVKERRLDLLVDEAILAERRARWSPPAGAGTARRTVEASRWFS